MIFKLQINRVFGLIQESRSLRPPGLQHRHHRRHLQFRQNAENRGSQTLDLHPQIPNFSQSNSQKEWRFRTRTWRLRSTPAQGQPGRRPGPRLCPSDHWKSAGKQWKERQRQKENERPENFLDRFNQTFAYGLTTELASYSSWITCVCFFVTKFILFFENFLKGIVLSPWRGIDPRKLISTGGKIARISMWEGKTYTKIQNNKSFDQFCQFYFVYSKLHWKKL